MASPFRDVLLPTSPYWEACARHQNRITTRSLAVLFLCDDCARQLTNECFNGRPPLYHGETFRDYFCGLCNEIKEVALRQWFICPICFNVVRSYPKAIAASQYVHKIWKERIQPYYPDFMLEETEQVEIEPFIPGRRTQRAKAVSVDRLDFIVSEKIDTRFEPRFHIELKAGPTAIADMREFQLDVNDFNDIKTVAIKTSLPVYIFHVQIIDEYKLPTRRTVALDMWWTDLLTLRRALKAVRRRRGEDKDAGYYDPSVFRTMGTFIDELAQRKYLTLQQEIARTGIPDLPGRRGT